MYNDACIAGFICNALQAFIMSRPFPYSLIFSSLDLSDGTYVVVAMLPPHPPNLTGLAYWLLQYKGEYVMEYDNL